MGRHRRGAGGDAGIRPRGVGVPRSWRRVRRDRAPVDDTGQWDLQHPVLGHHPLAHLVAKVTTGTGLEPPSGVAWRSSCAVYGKGGERTMYIGGGVLLLILVIILLVWVF